MSYYRFPRLTTVLALGALWLVGLAVIAGASLTTAASTGDWAVRLLLTVGAAVGAALFARISISFRDVDAEIEARVEDTFRSSDRDRKAA